MTATQVAFAFVVLVVAPGFGLCGSVTCRQTRLGRTRGFALATLASWLGLALSGVIAALYFPRYPVEGPPEHAAMMFVVPSFVVGIGAVLLLSRLVPARPDAGDIASDRRHARRLLLAGVSLSSLMVATIYFWLVTPMHKALPWGARHVRESYWADGFLPDYSYCLKARISEDEFPGYVARLGLTPHTQARSHEDPTSPWLGWAHPFDLDRATESGRWWDPPPIEAGKTYVAQSGDEWILAAYKDGWLYVSGLNH